MNTILKTPTQTSFILNEMAAVLIDQEQSDYSMSINTVTPSDLDQYISIWSDLDFKVKRIDILPKQDEQKSWKN